MFNQETINTLISGGVGILPTDTIYGVVGNALDPDVVEKIYQIKGRESEKPFVILVNSLEDLWLLNIFITSEQQKTIESLWPGPVSVILPCEDPFMEYLHRGKNCLAVRMPDNKNLQDLLEQTGPLVATSANISNQAYVSDIDAIRRALPGMDFYEDGNVGSTPSKLAKISPDGNIEWIDRKN